MYGVRAARFFWDSFNLAVENTGRKRHWALSPIWCMENTFVLEIKNFPGELKYIFSCTYCSL